MRFFKDKEGKATVLKSASDSVIKNIGLSEIPKDEYLQLVKSDELPEIVVPEKEDFTQELQFITEHGGLAKALYAVAVATGMVVDAPTKLSAEGVLVVDNFQDSAQSSFDLQIRNDTGDVVKGVVAVIENVPYSEIPDITYEAKLDYEVTKSESGYNHTFTFLDDLTGYAKIRITGGKVATSGVGQENGNLKLYING